MVRFESERKFEVFTYLATHGQLLLRSVLPLVQPRRVDVLFFDVRSIEIPVWLSGLRILELAFEGDESHDRYKAMYEPGLRHYRVETSNWVGSIIAGPLRIAEDEGGRLECSSLMLKETWDNPFGPVS